MLTYDLTERAGAPLYEYLYRCLRRDILSGKLAAGERLPGRRSFAEHLGVSPVTVDAAYSQLVAEGCVEARPRRGYFVAALALPKREFYDWQIENGQGFCAVWDGKALAFEGKLWQ